jgi:hypothetical protein
VVNGCVMLFKVAGALRGHYTIAAGNIRGAFSRSHLVCRPGLPDTSVNWDSRLNKLANCDQAARTSCPHFP